MSGAAGWNQTERETSLLEILVKLTWNNLVQVFKVYVVVYFINFFFVSRRPAF